MAAKYLLEISRTSSASLNLTLESVLDRFKVLGCCCGGGDDDDADSVFSSSEGIFSMWCFGILFLRSGWLLCWVDVSYGKESSKV